MLEESQDSEFPESPFDNNLVVKCPWNFFDCKKFVRLPVTDCHDYPISSLSNLGVINEFFFKYLHPLLGISRLIRKLCSRHCGFWYLSLWSGRGRNGLLHSAAICKTFYWEVVNKIILWVARRFFFGFLVRIWVSRIAELISIKRN